MALFNNAPELRRHSSDRTIKLASVNFVASSRVTEALAVSGHLALSAPSQIVGQFQFLKTLSHPNLCQYVEIHRGKHDRIFVVSEYLDITMQKARNLDSKTPPPVSLSILKQWAFEICSALQYLKENGIIHASLSPKNIMLDKENHIKLFGYGLYYMTCEGKYVDFPIGYPTYLAPECLEEDFTYSIINMNDLKIDEERYNGSRFKSNDKRDIWALGVVLVEQYTRNSFWTTSDVGLIFDTLMTLREWSEEDSEQTNIWCHEGIETLDINKAILKFLQTEEDGDKTEETTATINQKEDEIKIDQLRLKKQFREFVLNCLKVVPEERLSITDALNSDFFEEGITSLDATAWVEGPILASDVVDPETIDSVNSQSQEDAQEVLKGLPASQIYHLWKLAGGDVELDLVKRGVFLSTPVIHRLPRVCLMPDGIEIGEKITDTAQLYLDAIYVLSFKELYQRLEERNSKNGETFEWDTDYFNLVEENDVNFLLEDDENEGSTFMNEDNHASENEEGFNDRNEVEDIVDDFMFSTSPNSNFNNPSPTANESMSSATATGPTISKVNSTSRLSINGNKNNSIVGRSRSTSSLSMNSIASINTVNGVSATNKLPLFLREQDIDYQNYRQALFSELLRQYPASRQEIIHHAKVDIPPILRGKIWAAILGVSGDLQYEYDQINKYVDMGADRQIEVDVPRCHQYNQLLASSVGHEKLRRLLKAWVCANKNLVYWQGLDSLCAPFLTLNFNDEAIAFACLQKFIPRFLNNFFLSDNAPVLQEYLAIFRHLLSFHDPELSTHLDAIGFMPDLYAIPWFLTLFTHVFPLDKIYHLWDKFLVGPSSLPLFAGIAILRQIRDTLLSYEFNDCIVLFSDSFPRVDIEKCVQSALSMCKVTPLSIVARMHGPSSLESIGKSTHDDGEEKNSKIVKSVLNEPSTQLWWEKPISIEMKKVELAPRLFVTDLLKILAYSLILDIRPETEFVRGHVPSSMNVLTEQLPSYANIIKKVNRKYHIVVASRSQEGPEYAAELVRRNFSRVALLQGGIDAASSSLQICKCRPQKQTTAGFKGKGSEPPFVMWRCKATPPTIKS